MGINDKELKWITSDLVTSPSIFLFAPLLLINNRNISKPGHAFVEINEQVKTFHRLTLSDIERKNLKESSITKYRTILFNFDQ